MSQGKAGQRESGPRGGWELDHVGFCFPSELAGLCTGAGHELSPLFKLSLAAVGRLGGRAV